MLVDETVGRGGGGEVGDDGAVLELEDVLLELVFGVVDGLVDETVELESDACLGNGCILLWVLLC